MKEQKEAATISDILYFFGQGNALFNREMSGNSQGILKSSVSSNHDGSDGKKNSTQLFFLIIFSDWIFSVIFFFREGAVTNSAI